jgi:hypothetical protein
MEAASDVKRTDACLSEAYGRLATLDITDAPSRKQCGATKNKTPTIASKKPLTPFRMRAAFSVMPRRRLSPMNIATTTRRGTT